MTVLENFYWIIESNRSLIVENIYVRQHWIEKIVKIKFVTETVPFLKIV